MSTMELDCISARFFGTDGSFHAHGNDGVYHFGFDRDKLTEMATKCGFVDAAFTTALTLEKPDRTYPVFLFSAYKA